MLPNILNCKWRHDFWFSIRREMSDKSSSESWRHLAVAFCKWRARFSLTSISSEDFSKLSIWSVNKSSKTCSLFSSCKSFLICLIEKSKSLKKQMTCRRSKSDSW